MCGRYYIAEDDAQIGPFLAEGAERAARLGIEMKQSGEIRPTETVPVLATGQLKRKPGVYPMQWGFPHPKRTGVLVFNTRAETAGEKAFFCTSVAERRCLIPATRYYEWKKEGDGKKHRFAFGPETDEPLLLAGLYIRDRRLKLPAFSILTVDAAETVKEYHARMPFTVPLSMAEEWLCSDVPYGELLSRTGVPIVRVEDDGLLLRETDLTAPAAPSLTGNIAKAMKL